MDKYQDVRNIPLRSVLASLGFTGFKKRAGKQEWYGSCPFHGPKKNKTSFSFDDRRFNCFSCGECGSGAIDLVMKLKKVGFQDAVHFLGVSEQSNGGKSVEEVATSKQGFPNDSKNIVLENKPFAGTYEKYYVKSDWLKNRGLTEETLKLFGVGQYFNPSRKSAYSNKVLFAIRRFSDSVKVGYLARTIEKESSDPKYIFPKGFHKQLEVFGAWQIKQHAAGEGLALPHRVGFVVESPLCVMKYWQLGLFSVSLWGAYASEEQVKILAQLFRGVVYLPDRDKSLKVADTIQLVARHLWIKLPELPAGIDDPENLSHEQILALVKS